MAESGSPSLSPQSPPKIDLDFPISPLRHIPVEIVSDEEMAIIEAAFTAARSSSSSLSSFLSPARFRPSIHSISLISNRSLSRVSASANEDIEDIGANRRKETPLQRYRRNRGLAVTDFTSTEWCEKQKEFSLIFGKPEVTKAMKAGIARHTELEEEVLEREKIRTKTTEDIWALKFMNFMIGANQLLFDGLTRELPVIGNVEGVWMVGVIDEIRLPDIATKKNPTLVDTKTRVQATLPSEAQRRNGRLQLMCYKYLWDNLVCHSFPSEQFFDFFSLDPHSILSKEIREKMADFGFPTETLDDLFAYFRNSCSILPRAHDQLLLRYELQEDRSLLGEDRFVYDGDWLKGKLKQTLEFWHGEREAKYVAEGERWKCNHCNFAPGCPINSNSVDDPRLRNSGS